MEFLKILMFLFFTSISYKVQSEDLTLAEHTNSSGSKNYSLENVGKETPYNLMDPQEVKRLSKQYQKITRQIISYVTMLWLSSLSTIKKNLFG